ncbi:aminotransferase class IV [Cypionkella aquatica]|uniref:Probable branched-chain-amino-acid aminotransferase n=1 Tax=Cypionkella aquatica TaxID=1756042 RepID=A0AA37WZD9_9RHOB|nr:aminotransferase class IV family protein [Cypionkella aquatica]GLS86478.1 aminotransferase class IV [Cypionkella aquatica]
MESALRAGAGAAGLKLSELKLIETLAWDGQALRRLPLHLARLAGSAARLGWACDLAAVEATLVAAVPVGPARMRLTLDAAGRIEVQVADLPAAKALWRVGLASERLCAGDVWLSIKSTRRAAYDAARAALPAGLDEVILCNERGEVCDGTITTVFFDRGQGMRTPPLHCGLLPGVLRAELGVPEQLLLIEDVPKVRLWVGNSVRGLIPAIWVT